MHAAVLEPGTGAKEAVARPLPEAVLRNALTRGARVFKRLTPELQGTVGVVAGMCIGIALWLFLGTSLLGDNVAAQFVSLFIFVGAGGFSGGAGVMLRRNFGEDDGYA